MKLPKAMLRHFVGLEPYLGADATGPQYGPIQWRRAYLEQVYRSVRSTDGRVIVAGTAVWLQLDLSITPEWRVRIGTQIREVLDVRQFNAQLGTPDHTQILLQ